MVPHRVLATRQISPLQDAGDESSHFWHKRKPLYFIRHIVVVSQPQRNKKKKTTILSPSRNKYCLLISPNRDIQRTQTNPQVASKYLMLQNITNEIHV